MFAVDRVYHVVFTDSSSLKWACEHSYWNNVNIRKSWFLSDCTYSMNKFNVTDNSEQELSMLSTRAKKSLRILSLLYKSNKQSQELLLARHYSSTWTTSSLVRLTFVVLSRSRLIHDISYLKQKLLSFCQLCIMIYVLSQSCQLKLNRKQQRKMILKALHIRKQERINNATPCSRSAF